MSEDDLWQEERHHHHHHHERPWVIVSQTHEGETFWLGPELEAFVCEKNRALRFESQRDAEMLTRDTMMRHVERLSVRELTHEEFESIGGE